MKKTPQQFAEALFLATRDLKETAAKEAVTRFVALLSKEHKLRWAEKIIQHFEKISRREAGIKKIEIRSARPLSKTIVEEIKKQFGGKQTLVTEQIEAELLAGVIIREDDKIWNLSLKQQLTTLKKQLSAWYV